jgi:hypothetical protein
MSKKHFLSPARSQVTSRRPSSKSAVSQVRDRRAGQRFAATNKKFDEKRKNKLQNPSKKVKATKPPKKMMKKK